VLDVLDPVQWVVSFFGANETIYSGEKFKLRIIFPDVYPMEAPEVVFLPGFVPQHPHVYSNGHICLNILGDDWSPALTVRSVCFSILSMLSSCQLKEWPTDNDRYTKNKRGTPKDTNFIYHDDGV
jgi:ubiquitin-conjugating enzyme E2 W